MYHLQHSTELSKDERVNEWMLFNSKYRSVNSIPLLTYHCDFTIITIWLLLNEDASWNKQSVIGRLFGADNRPKHYRCTSSNYGKLCVMLTLQTVEYSEWFQCPVAGRETCHYMTLHVTHDALLRTQHISCTAPQQMSTKRLQPSEKRTTSYPHESLLRIVKLHFDKLIQKFVLSLDETI